MLFFFLEKRIRVAYWANCAIGGSEEIDRLGYIELYELLHIFTVTLSVTHWAIKHPKSIVKTESTAGLMVPRRKEAETYPGTFAFDVPVHPETTDAFLGSICSHYCSRGVSELNGNSSIPMMVA